MDKITPAKPICFHHEGSFWTVTFDAAGQLLCVSKADVVWTADSGTANRAMSERVRRIIEIAKTCNV